MNNFTILHMGSPYIFHTSSSMITNILLSLIQLNPFSAGSSKVLLFEGFSAILV